MKLITLVNFLVLLNLGMNCENSFAEYPYETLDDSYNKIGVKASKEVSNLSPTKTQDGVGLCYGFAATTLLENYRCRTMNINCLDKEEQLSSVDVSSYFLSNREKGVREAGDTVLLLRNFKNSERKLAKESCAKFSSLVRKSNNLYVPDEGQGWKFLVNAWKNLKKQPRSRQPAIINCMASELKTRMPNLLTSTSQIKDALNNADSLESFLYKTIVPAECTESNNQVNIPDFEVEAYPSYNQKFSVKGMADKIENVLMNDIPLEISICTVPSEPSKCPDDAGHAVTLFAIREACSPLESQCRTMVRIKNSYGYRWQQENNDGWVDLATLITASQSYAENNNIVWIKKPGTKIADLKLTRTGSAQNTNYDRQNNQYNQSNQSQNNNRKGVPVPAKWKDYKGIWKCPGNSYLDHFEANCTPFMEFK